ncbi:tetratricopeptide (TPR) repeat protein [Paraburkholderia youngii]|uniref:TRAFs-binding domain-containing protein n=1 Tax=Paraburkholderia youngii TaxID=2782701 RepID=UPI003D1B8B4C
MQSEEKDSRKVCFVVMGFGKKTDYESGRTLDLDATYEAIINPAAEAAGLRCVRADDVKHSGIIDSEMYELLLRAELVIADISTGNVNAIYELGVRHALRPNSTIVMSEAGGKLHFDLNHISTFQYAHQGDDIGYREVVRARASLAELIDAAMKSGKTDSPVYTFLPGLRPPRTTTERYEELLSETEHMHERLSEHLRAGDQAQKDSRHADAVRAFAIARSMKPDDPYILQQLALATYKAAQPSALDALLQASTIIAALNPDESNDPETLGIAGAIRKRLWQKTLDRAQLDAAIRYYQRGFEIRRDYYNGENLATCFDFRARVQDEPDERMFDRMSARKVRQSLIELLTDIVGQPIFTERSDRRWIFATLSNCLRAIGNMADADAYEQRFMLESPAEWERKTFEESKALLDTEMAA